MRLFELVGGHPYLVHYALYNIASRRYTAAQFFSHVLSDNSPFSDHLNHLLFRLYGRDNLSTGLRQIIDRQTCRDERLLHRLQGAGLVRRDGDRVQLSRQLYADFFRSRLPAPRFFSLSRLGFSL